MGEATTMDTSHTVEAAAKVATYGGSASAFLFGLTANEFAAVSGVVIALVGLAVQVIFALRRDRREENAIRARLGKTTKP